MFEVDGQGVAKTTEDVFQERRLAWAVELESGRRKQVEGKLGVVQDDGSVLGYCCIGVAGEVACELGAEIDRAVDMERKVLVFEDEDADFPEELADWLGVDTGIEILVAPSVIDRLNDGRDEDHAFEDGWECTFIEMNDTFGLSFEEIAASIRHHFKLPAKAV